MNREEFEMLLYFLFSKDIDLSDDAHKRAEQVMLQSDLFTDRDYTEGVLKDVQTPTSR